MIIFGLEHAVRPTQRSPFWIVTVRSILVFFDRFCHCYHSFITMSNITSSDSDATISYGSESHKLPSKNSGGRVWPPTAAVGKATASTSGTRPSTCSFSRVDSDSDTDDYYTELSSSSSDEVWLYSCMGHFHKKGQITVKTF